MPYIDPRDRERLDQELIPLLDPGHGPQTEGELNYCITRLLCTSALRRYADFNGILGVLEAAKQEFYRRVVAPYEDEKVRVNGEVFPERLLPPRPRTISDGTGRGGGW